MQRALLFYTLSKSRQFFFQLFQPVCSTRTHIHNIRQLFVSELNWKYNFRLHYSTYTHLLTGQLYLVTHTHCQRAPLESRQVIPACLLCSEQLLLAVRLQIPFQPVSRTHYQTALLCHTHTHTHTLSNSSTLSHTHFQKALLKRACWPAQL